MEFIVFFIVFSILLYTLYTILSPNRVVLVSTRTKYVLPILNEIIEFYKNDISQMTFLEIGAGYGKVSRHAYKVKKFKNVTAVEINFFVVVFVRVLFFFKRLPINYSRKDILNYKISKQTFIYCYMSVYIVNTLYQTEKLEDCIFISLSFPITDVIPTRVYNVKGFQKKIYVYDFRKPQHAFQG